MGNLAYNYQAIPVEYFAFKEERFSQYPHCQRDYVWKLNKQRKLIDSILRGLPVPPVTILPSEDKLIGNLYYVVDGQQRLETVRRYINDEFATAERFRDEPLVHPVSPGKKYSELDDYHRQRIDNYPLQVCIVDGVPEKDLELVYRRLNYQVKLNLAERLYSYRSPAKEQGKKLVKHAFWSNVYLGKKDRKQVYQMTLMAMFMELYDVFCNMTTSRLLDIASGGNISKTFPSDLHEQINRRLDIAQRAFKGADMRAMTHIIPVYQALMLLEEDGYCTNQIDEGGLSTWFNELRIEALTWQKNAQGDFFARLTKVGEQRKFWAEQLPQIEATPNLIRRNGRRTFTVLDRLQAWQAQGGKCAICGKSVMTSDEGHHILPHAIGGKTNAANCLLIHRKCHQSLNQLDLI